MTPCKECCWWSPNRHDLFTRQEKLCLHPKIGIVTADDFGCTEAVSQHSTEANVPNHAPNPTPMTNEIPVDGPTEVLIVTYSKDFPWLVCALRSMRKFFHGFQGITVAHPRVDLELFETLLVQFDVKLHPYDEVQGKGMIQHMAKMASADLIVPEGTKYVLHSDADCIFKMATRPEDYFSGGKPYYLIRPWESLSTEDPNNPASKVVSDCYQWRRPTEMQLGFSSPWYTMCMNTGVLPIGFYKPYREHVANVQRKPFDEYMLSGKNSFPADRMDHTAMGAWAKHYMEDAFTWFDVSAGPYPQDRKKAFWSHGGITPPMREEIEKILEGNPVYEPPAPPIKHWKATPEELERMAQ